MGKNYMAKEKEKKKKKQMNEMTISKDNKSDSLIAQIKR